jgi:uncharacterized protein (TIGR00369 family)
METTIKSKNPEFKQAIQEKLKGQMFMKHVGIELTHIEAGEVHAEVCMQTFLEQQNGFLHGGVTATLVDIAMGFAAFSLVEDGKGVVTSSLQVNYFRPAQFGNIIAKAKVQKAGNILFYCISEVFEVYEGEEKLIASATATMCKIDIPDKKI